MRLRGRQRAEPPQVSACAGGRGRGRLFRPVQPGTASLAACREARPAALPRVRPPLCGAAAAGRSSYTPRKLCLAAQALLAQAAFPGLLSVSDNSGHREVLHRRLSHAIAGCLDGQTARTPPHGRQLLGPDHLPCCGRRGHVQRHKVGLLQRLRQRLARGRVADRHLREAGRWSRAVGRRAACIAQAAACMHWALACHARSLEPSSALQLVQEAL